MNYEGDYLGETIPIPTEDYSTGEMSPCKARAVTLKEVIEFCEHEMRKQEVDSGDDRGMILSDANRYFALNDVKTRCEKLLAEIKW